jgi:hypothetical protein
MPVTAAKTEKANLHAPEANLRFRVCAPEHPPLMKTSADVAGESQRGVSGVARGRV